MAKATTQNSAALTVDNCDKEPIHIPGCIQPFGCLLAGRLSLDRIEYCSANVGEFLSISPNSALGSAFNTVLPPDVLHDVRNTLALSSSATQRARVGIYTIGESSLEAFTHRNADGLAIVEFEPAPALGASNLTKPIDKMRTILAKAGAQPTLTQLLEVAAIGLRSLTGYDRVKAYRYAKDGSGEVVAEDRENGIESYLGLRYPAWDVPAQARVLQILNPVRLLSDVNQSSIDVLSHNHDAVALDLSLAHLRGVSEIHVQYLKNMNVSATLTIGLVVDGQLWGMFACHHMSPKVISSDTRIAAELFGQILSLVIQQKLESSAQEARLKAADARRRILAETDAESDLLQAFRDLVPIFRDVIDCDGTAIVREGKLLVDGSTPAPEAIREIASRRPEDENLVESTDSILEAAWAPGHDLQCSAGCMVVRATAAYPLQLLFFRDEIIQNVKWAGNPEKVMETGPFGPRISPRGSFESYLAEHRGRCEDWKADDEVAAREIQILLTQITAKGERAQLARHNDLVSHQRQQDLLIAELNHRVKNILALIRSLSRQAKDSSASLESYALALERRIAALAAAHDLAVSDSMTGVSLRSILEVEFEPYVSEDNSQVLLSGPAVGLSADVAPMIALVFHEVVTNAAKHGSLSTEDGVVRAKWSVSDDGLRFEWQELNGPVVVEPERHGFGQSLISKAIPYEFNGTVDLSYEPTGVKFSFTLPSENLVELNAEKPVRLVGTVNEIKRPASGNSVLLVEDNLILAMDMVDTLSRLGADRIETSSSVGSALAEIDRNKVDFAVLDMNLRGVVSFEIAERLIKDGVPFVFVTGYGSKIDVPPELSHIDVLTKPVDDAALSQALSRVLGK